MTMLEILGRASSINVRKVLWLCDELEIAWQREDWGIGFRSPKEEPFRALNPNALVPVIRDGAFILWESHAILRYLVRKHQAKNLLPDDPEAQAIVDQWMGWAATELNKAWRGVFLGLVRPTPGFDQPEQIEAATIDWSEKMHLLDNQLATTGGYVTGDTFTLADIPVGLVVHRWYASPIEHPELPAVNAYYQRLCERPAFATHGRDGGP
jgi:glutathione S-transferase